MVRKPIKYSSEVITVRGAVGFANSPELPPELPSIKQRSGTALLTGHGSLSDRAHELPA